MSDQAIDAVITAETSVLASGEISNPAGEKVFRGQAFIIEPPGQQASATSYIEGEIQRLRDLGWTDSSEINGVDYISDPRTDSFATFSPLSIVDTDSTDFSSELAEELEELSLNCDECVLATVEPMMK